MSLISIVIPAYREAKNLPIVTAHIVQTMSTYIAEIPSISYEILIVDDGSPDDTWIVIQELCTTYVQVRGIALSRNFGKELAITAGLEAARGDAILTMDADGQHPVEQIPAFVRTWQEGYDIVYNKRPEIDGASWLKRYTSHMFYAIFNSISEFKLEPQTTDYRLLSRDVVDSYLRFREKNRMYRGLVDWMGYRRKALIFDAEARLHGSATYTYRKLFALAVNNLTSFSLFPLKLIGYMGTFIVICSSIMLCLQILDKLGVIHMMFSNIGIVIVLNTIMTGIVLMTLGLIGLYIANIHEEVIGRPLYIVRERVGK